MRNFIDRRDSRYEEVPENLTSERCKEKIDEILDDPAGYKVTDEYNHKDVRSLLRKYFGIKCIYCEASPIATSTFRVDHYRPKKNIKDILHKGYYWLAYEWSNLLQSCQLCNGFKSNQFPLEAGSIRVDETNVDVNIEKLKNPTISPLADEKRLLLHPELDKVEKHFSFNPDGTIESDTTEGNKSIECYGLKRVDLIFVRKQIRDENLSDIKEALITFQTNYNNGIEHSKDILFNLLNDKFRKFLKAYVHQGAFSLFNFYMFDKFYDFFIEEIKIKEHRNLLLEAYNLYKDKSSI